MKVLFSDFLLGNYCCKQCYKHHISFCEVEKYTSFPPRTRKVFSRSMRICIILRIKTNWREHVSAFTSTCDSRCISICLCPESARLTNSHHGRLVCFHRTKKYRFFMFQIGHWHGNTQLDRWWMLGLDSIWLIFWCRKTAYTLFIW